MLFIRALGHLIALALNEIDRARHSGDVSDRHIMVSANSSIKMWRNWLSFGFTKFVATQVSALELLEDEERGTVSALLQRHLH